MPSKMLNRQLKLNLNLYFSGNLKLNNRYLAFTLIEMLIVMTIMMILTAMSIAST